MDAFSGNGVTAVLGPGEQRGVKVVLMPGSSATATFRWLAKGQVIVPPASDIERMEQQTLGALSGPPKRKYGDLPPGRYTVTVPLSGAAGTIRVKTQVRVVP